MRYTIHGSATNKELEAELKALRAEIAALRGKAAASVAVDPFEATAREGHKFEDTREARKADKREGFYCARHDHGFAFRKDKCPRDGGPLA